LAKRDDILKEKLDRLETVPERFTGRARAFQQTLLDTVLATLRDMTVEDGNFVTSADNLNVVDRIVDEMRRTLLGGEYVDDVRDFANEFDTQVSLNNQYTQLEFDFEGSEAGRALVNRAKRQAVERLVNIEFVNPNLYDPIRTQLDDAVSSGAGLQDTIRNLRLSIVGGEVDAGERRLGLLHRYAKQISLDAFNQADATYLNEVSEELEVEWYQYLGGKISTTRDFCERRNGNYYPKAQIQSWTTNSKSQPKPVVKWDGMIRGTNAQTIFIYRGGWNCMHSIAPVSVFSVPENRLREAMTQGYWQPSQSERNLLNL
jgi:hypothetical protein